MDSVPTHIIRRQILEFRGVREADARQLQEEIGELFREKILPLLDRYMSEHSPGDVTHRIDLMELDIGTVFRNRLDQDFVEKVIRQLEIYFQSLPSSGSIFETEKEEVPVEKSHLEIFSFFIETGNLPWWADLKNNDPVKKSLDFLIREEESALRNLMYKWVRGPNALKRIVVQTGFPKWAELAATNLDCTGEELASMLSRLMDLLKKITPWSNYPDHKLQEILGLKLLPWVFLSTRKTQTTTDFWNSFLLQLTREPVRYDDSFADLFLRFEKNKIERREDDGSVAFLSKQKTPGGSLQAQILERIERLLKVEALAPEKKIQWLEQLQKLKEQEVDDKDLQVIMQLLERETAVEPDSGRDKKEVSKAAVSERIKRLLEVEALSPEKKIQWFEQLQKLNEQEVDDKDLQVIMQLLERETAVEPDSGRDKKEVSKAAVSERIKRLLEVETLSPEKKIQWLERLQKLNEQETNDKDLQVIMQLLESEISDAAEDIDRPEVPGPVKIFSDTDELFISNSGLVILHPFLNRFFENLNLLVDRRFANAAAAHRAVGLLQFLADGREIPAEHQCGLNKILCGLDAETVLEFGEPVTTEEAEACQTLLEAVIANAPILGEMSAEGFRGSFLIRKGIIRSGIGAWQLNVEKETFDVVLERFPWNWSIVKLPWMQWAISVEWV